jgi:cytochrome c5
MAQRRTALFLACAAGLATGAAAAPAVTEPPPPGEYRVTQGRVDRGTFMGWRVFHSACHGCHGVGAVGTDLAPNLAERVRTMTPREFTTKVLTSYRLVPPATGGREEDRARELEATVEEILRRERGSARARVLMPAWAGDDAVPPHVLDLYAYLSARGDGKLGPGKPAVQSARRR